MSEENKPTTIRWNVQGRKDLATIREKYNLDSDSADGHYAARLIADADLTVMFELKQRVPKVKSDE